MTDPTAPSSPQVPIPASAPASLSTTPTAEPGRKLRQPAKTATTVLAILSAILLLASAGVGVLFYLDHNQSVSTRQERDAEIAELESKIEEAKSQIRAEEESANNAAVVFSACSRDLDMLFVTPVDTVQRRDAYQAMYNMCIRGRMIDSQ